MWVSSSRFCATMEYSMFSMVEYSTVSVVEVIVGRRLT